MLMAESSIGWTETGARPWVWKALKAVLAALGS